MTKEERQLVIEYVNAEILNETHCQPMSEDMFTQNRELLIAAHYNTVNFKLYALRNAWKNLVKPIKDAFKKLKFKIWTWY